MNLRILWPNTVEALQGRRDRMRQKLPPSPNSPFLATLGTRLKGACDLETSSNGYLGVVLIWGSDLLTVIAAKTVKKKIYFFYVCYSDTPKI